MSHRWISTYLYILVDILPDIGHQVQWDIGFHLDNYRLVLVDTYHRHRDINLHQVYMDICSLLQDICHRPADICLLLEEI